MARLGWCRECGEWVWVDEETECVGGHGEGCLERVHEIGSPDDSDKALSDLPPEMPRPVVMGLEGRGFGVGELPADALRFNWGAFTLPLFWAFTYGAWPIVSWWLISLMVPLMLASATGVDGTASTLTQLVGVSVVSEIVNGLVRLWAGLNGNRLVWAREQRRLSLLPSAVPRFSVERFVARQRVWAIAGAVALGVAAVGTAYMNARAWGEFGLSYLGAAEPIVWLTAEVVLGLWLAGKLRSEAEGPKPLGGEA